MSQKDGYPSSVATGGGGILGSVLLGYQNAVWLDKFSASGEKDCGRRDLSAENQAEDSGLKNSTLVAQAIAARGR
jgi:hypothetical protein